MSEPCDGGGPVMNTDVHLWPKIQAPDAEYLAVYGVGDDAISIQVGYNVVVTKPIRAWYELQAENERLTTKVLETTAAWTDAQDRITALEADIASRQSWQELAFQAHPNLDLDIEAVKSRTDEK